MNFVKITEKSMGFFRQNLKQKSTNSDKKEKIFQKKHGENAVLSIIRIYYFF